MSFEGRYQKLCPNGHYEEQDVYMETLLCAECGEKWEKSNLVDDTNGANEGYDYSMIPKESPKPLELKQSFGLFLADWKAKHFK
jgi:hypothetical protein